MDKVKELENRIIELEYRLGVLEQFLDQAEMLYHKNDESTMNAIKMDMLRRTGLQTGENGQRLGTKFFSQKEE